MMAGMEEFLFLGYKDGAPMFTFTKINYIRTSLLINPIHPI